MLELLSDCLKANSYYMEESLKDIPNSTCLQSDLKVLDLYKIKVKFFNEVDGNQLTSMSAGYFSFLRETIYFIQILSPEALNREKWADIEKEIKIKTKDTIITILGIVGHKSIDKIFYRYLYERNGIKIKTLIVSDIDYVGSTIFQFSNLDSLYPFHEPAGKIKNRPHFRRS